MSRLNLWTKYDQTFAALQFDCRGFGHLLAFATDRSAVMIEGQVISSTDAPDLAARHGPLLGIESGVTKPQFMRLFLQALRDNKVLTVPLTLDAAQ